MVHKFSGSVAEVTTLVETSELTDAAKAFVLSHLTDDEGNVNLHISEHSGSDANGVCAGVTVTVHKAA